MAIIQIDNLRVAVGGVLPVTLSLADAKAVLAEVDRLQALSDAQAVVLRSASTEAGLATTANPMTALVPAVKANVTAKNEGAAREDAQAKVLRDASTEAGLPTSADPMTKLVPAVKALATGRSSEKARADQAEADRNAQTARADKAESDRDAQKARADKAEADRSSQAAELANARADAAAQTRRANSAESARDAAREDASAQTRYADELVNLLGECRDAFPIPAPGTELEGYWGAAIGLPESVPEYVRAQVAALTAQPAPTPAPPAPSTSPAPAPAADAQADRPYPMLPRMGAVGYASARDVALRPRWPIVGPHMPGSREVALWTTDQLHECIEYDRAAAAREAEARASS